MNSKNKLFLAATVAIMSGSVLASTQAFAASNATDESVPMSSLAQRIAEKFGLDQAEVQVVFDQEREAMHAKMQADYEERLTQLVSEGKLTEQQKQLILSKHAELQANRQSVIEGMKDKTDEERKVAMNTERQELTDWAKENGIDVQYLMFKHGRGHGRPGDHTVMKMIDANASTTAKMSE